VCVCREFVRMYVCRYVRAGVCVCVYVCAGVCVYVSL